ncbi:MAG: hypothetical protein C4547_02115 [Phycisphaerales bacterium]|nr:MAG: hypothetical protein C4547_02115 [Phycisphaerales bacterium]
MELCAVSQTEQRSCEPGPDAARPSGVNWNDPTVPAGNAPPMPRWPLYLAAAAWFAWIVFLLVTLVTRTRIDPI